MNGVTPSGQIAELTELVDEFARQRDWEQFHTPKNLAMAISVEASELLELFQWSSGAEDLEILTEKRASVEHEVADVLAYLLRFCSVAKIDLEQALRRKVELNAQKYPAEQVRGKSAKYSEY